MQCLVGIEFCIAALFTEMDSVHEAFACVSDIALEISSDCMDRVLALWGIVYNDVFVGAILI